VSHKKNQATILLPELNILQGNVDMHLKCGGTLNDDFTANLLVSLSVKNCENRLADKSVVAWFF